MENNSKKLSTLGLAMLGVSLMIGSAAFSFPRTMASGSSVGAVLLSWLITGFGMYFLTNSFVTISKVDNSKNNGVYSYGKKSLGNYFGFVVGWGYYISSSLAIVGSSTLVMSSMNYFFPGKFVGGNNPLSVLCISIIIWLYHFLVLKGIKEAVLLNTISTFVKIASFVLFILLVLFGFKFSIFTQDFWGNIAQNSGNVNMGSLMDQVKSTMFITLWAFAGIEGAAVLSGRAKEKKSAGIATLAGFLICLVIYMLVSILPYGVMSIEELAALQEPSVAGVLEHIIGRPGVFLMNSFLIISVLASWLSWFIVSTESLLNMADEGDVPQIFTRTNKNNVPHLAALTTSLVLQVSIFLTVYAENAWSAIYNIGGVLMLPMYFTAPLYLFKLIRNDNSLIKTNNLNRCVMYPTVSLGIAYAAWLVYAAGLSYMLMGFTILILGTPLYLWAKNENSKGNLLSSAEKMQMAAMVVASILSTIYLILNYNNI